jgi:hypothetical protein
MSDEWLNIFSKEEMENIETRAERIEEDMSTVYEITFLVPRDQAIDLCRHYDKMGESLTPSMESLMYIASLLTSLVSTIESALEIDGIDPYED